VAVSLIVFRETNSLINAITTLIDTDVGRDPSKFKLYIFYYPNDPGSTATKYMRDYTEVNGDKHVTFVEVENVFGDNQGIVKPRIDIMKAIMAYPDPIDYVIESHDDIWYFQYDWFSVLIQVTCLDRCWRRPQPDRRIPSIPIRNNIGDYATLCSQCCCTGL
jgi:hypothetical protein